MTVKKTDACKCSDAQLSRHAKGWSLFWRLNLQPCLGAACAGVKALSQKLEERDRCVTGRRDRGSKDIRRGNSGNRWVADDASDVKELRTVKALTAHKCQGSGQVASE